MEVLDVGAKLDLGRWTEGALGRIGVLDRGQVLGRPGGCCGGAATMRLLECAEQRRDSLLAELQICSSSFERCWTSLPTTLRKCTSTNIRTSLRIFKPSKGLVGVSHLCDIRHSESARLKSALENPLPLRDSIEKARRRGSVVVARLPPASIRGKDSG